MALPSLWGGYFMDDYAQLAVLSGRGRTPSAMTPDDLFVFADGNAAHLQQQIDSGIFPWWTVPDVKLAFWRPLSGWLMRLDHAAFGERAWLHHAHSLLWLVALIAVVSALYRRTLPPGPDDRRGPLPPGESTAEESTTEESTAGREGGFRPAGLGAAALAALLFTLDDAHAWPVLWVANRNAAVSAVFGLLALLAHHRARTEGWRPGVLLAPLLLAVALTGGETALALAAYFPAYELWMAPGSRRTRLLRLAPFAALVLGYLALHAAMGYGAENSGVYLDPRATPMLWLQAAPGRLLALIGCLLLNSPVDLWAVTEKAQPPLIGAALAAIALLGWMTRRLWPELSAEQRTTFKFYATGAVLALVPVLSTFPSPRLCMTASLGAFGCIALLVTAALQQQSRGLRRAAKGLVALHLVATIGWLPMHMVLGGTARRAQAMVHTIDFGELRQDSLMVTLFAPDPISSFYALMIRDAEGLASPAQNVILSMSPHAHRYTRTGERQLELSVIDGRLLDTPIEQLVRSSDNPLHPGDQLHSEHLDAEVLATEQGRVTNVRFTFRRSLDDPRMLLMWWRDGTLRRVPALAIGESITAPASLGLFGPVLGE